MSDPMPALKLTDDPGLTPKEVARRLSPSLAEITTLIEAGEMTAKQAQRLLRCPQVRRMLRVRNELTRTQMELESARHAPVALGQLVELLHDGANQKGEVRLKTALSLIELANCLPGKRRRDEPEPPKRPAPPELPRDVAPAKIGRLLAAYAARRFPDEAAKAGVAVDRP